MSVAPSRFVLPYQTVIDATGVPIPGAQLFFYESGTSTPLDTYSDVDLTVPNTNPVEADAGGRFPNIFMLTQNYKVVLTDALGDEIWTADPVEGTGGAGTGQNIRTVTGNTTVQASDQILEVDATLGDVVVTYPLALGTTQATHLVQIIKIDETNNHVSIITDASPNVVFALIEPANGSVMQSVSVYSNGDNIRILG